MQFEYRTCNWDEDGKAHKTCHCAGSDFIFNRGASRWDEDGIDIPGLSEGNKFKWDEDWKIELRENVRDAYGQFFRSGTFPENTLLPYNELPDGHFNIIGTEIGQLVHKYSHKYSLEEHISNCVIALLNNRAVQRS